jgi:hypothetical protein
MSPKDFTVRKQWHLRNSTGAYMEPTKTNSHAVLQFHDELFEAFHVTVNFEGDRGGVRRLDDVTQDWRETV